MLPGITMSALAGYKREPHLVYMQVFPSFSTSHIRSSSRLLGRVVDDLASLDVGPLVPNTTSVII